MALRSISFLGRKIYTKHRLIADIVKDKNVVHYGCVDDDEHLIKHKITDNRYLHAIVTKNAKETVGIDINKEAFPFLNKIGIDNIYYGDVENVASFEVEESILKNADVLLIPDLIEHLNNPGEMLEGIKSAFNKDVKIYILTPNPFAWYNFVATLLNKEIYTDYHTMYFTSESMRILLGRHGITVNKIIPVFSPKHRSGIVRLVDSVASKVSTSISPGFADLYMYECSIGKK